MRDYLLQSAITATISMLPKLSGEGGEAPEAGRTGTEGVLLIHVRCRTPPPPLTAAAAAAAAAAAVTKAARAAAHQHVGCGETPASRGCGRCRRRAPPRAGRRLARAVGTICSRHCGHARALPRVLEQVTSLHTPRPHRPPPRPHIHLDLPRALASNLPATPSRLTLPPPTPPATSPPHHPPPPPPHLLPHQVKKLFLAMPAEIQARVLLTAIRHPGAPVGRPGPRAPSRSEPFRSVR